MAVRDAQIIEDKEVHLFSNAEIGARYGMSPKNVADRVKIIEKQLGRKLPNKPKSAPAGPILGIGAGSKAFRHRLAYEMARVRSDAYNLSTSEIAFRVGIPAQSQTEASEGNSKHDWTISQIQRLADLRGYTFENYMLYLLTGKRL